MATLTKDGDTDVWTDRKARLRWRVSNAVASTMPGYDFALLARAQYLPCPEWVRKLRCVN